MADMELELLQGTVSAVVFQNPENGYAVLRLSQPGGEPVTVVGTIPMPVMGERLMVTGKWTSHSSYGRQFEAEFLERLLPETKTEILGYLSARTVKGIGPKLAARIVDRFGDETLKILERKPERLAEISGISAEKARSIGQYFHQMTGMRSLMEFLTLHHLPGELAVKLYKLYGDTAMETVYEDPYLLSSPGLDGDFGLVDRFAIEIGMESDDPRRIEAGLRFELRYNLNGGHTFLPEEKLLLATAQLLSIDREDAAARLEPLEEQGRLVRRTLAGIPVVYLPELYEAETYLRDRIGAMAARTVKTPAGLSRLVRQAARDNDIQYSPRQEEAICQGVSNGILLITGGPGTGKTTILKGLLDVLDQLGEKTLLAAPTGRAAKRLSEVTDKPASTIHRLLETQLDPETGLMVFQKDEDQPLDAAVVVVDECSMVDVLLMNSLLRAVPERARLILVGDPDQLPPVGPGCPFSDMIRSERVPLVRLTEIFRQAQESLIVMNAHRVNRGELPDLAARDRDFFFLRRRAEEAAAQTIVDLVSQRLPKNMGIPASEIQVLSPTRKGGCGTARLNAMLQAALNPPSPDKREKKTGEILFREGDKVMQIRNNYDILWKKSDGSALGTGIFNGDIGVILDIDLNMETVQIRFDDRIAEYSFDMLSELEPAYAVTVHKSQGSEYRAVVLAVYSGSAYLLTRSVLYTAITRARELLVLVGREEVVETMTANEKRSRRYSGLKLRLQGKDQ